MQTSPRCFFKKFDAFAIVNYRIRIEVSARMFPVRVDINTVSCVQVERALCFFLSGSPYEYNLPLLMKQVFVSGFVYFIETSASLHNKHQELLLFYYWYVNIADPEDL